MARQFHDIDASTIRSYATEATLDAAIAKHGWADHRYLTVCNRAGRFTAIFARSEITDGNLCRYANRGFMTVG